MFKIGEFSKLCGLSVDTLYHYEKLKILVPITVDKLTGYRYYDASQMMTVNKIIGKTMDTLFEWLKCNNYLADGAVREIYHKGEWATDNPDEYISELQIPIK